MHWPHFRSASYLIDQPVQSQSNVALVFSTFLFLLFPLLCREICRFFLFATKNESCIFNFEDNRPEEWEIVYDITSKRIKNVCYNYVWIIILYLIILIIIYFKTVQRTAVCSDIHFSRRKISLINIFFFHSLSLSFFYLRAHTYPIRGAKLINTGTLRFQFRFRVGPVWRRDGNSSSRNTKHDLRSRFNISNLDWTRFDPLFSSFTSSVDNRSYRPNVRNATNKCIMFHLFESIVRLWPGM